MFSEKVTSKFIYFGAIISMCAILIFLTYNYFLRSIKVDVMKDIELTFIGENGNASVSAINGSDDINKRTQTFLDTVKYEINPNTFLSNGDTIHVVASYDEGIASQYHFQVKNQEKDFLVEGLNYRYESLEEIDVEYLDRVIEAAKTYAEGRQSEIYEFDTQKQDGEFIEAQPVFKAFMKSNSLEISDRVIVVFKMIYNVESDTEEEIQQHFIYYTVTVPDVNDGNKISSDIFGEKAYLTEDEYETENVEGYIQRLYNSQFSIFEIVDPVEEETEETEETESNEEEKEELTEDE